MQLLAEISEGTLGLSDTYAELNDQHTVRKSARAILLDSEGKMATQYLRTYAYHKLPGGGIEQGESREQALRREVREEVGCDCIIAHPVGTTIEYRHRYNLLHISYCFVAHVVGDIGEATLEAKELEEGQITRWLPPPKALSALQTDTPQNYSGHFISNREHTFVQSYLQTVS